jgi:hypothetical protein
MKCRRFGVAIPKTVKGIKKTLTFRVHSSASYQTIILTCRQNVFARMVEFSCTLSGKYPKYRM